MSELADLLSLSFATAEARDANAAIDAAREQAGERSRSYEVLVAPAETLAQVAARLLPKLVYHLDSTGHRLPATGNLFLSLFMGEQLHFVRLDAALPLLAESVGQSMEGLIAAHGTGELRRAVAPGEPLPKNPTPPSLAPLLLPGKPT